jgi:TPR repeat protein
MRSNVRIFASLVLTAAAAACAQPAQPVADADPMLLEAVDWYTGVAGSVDYTQARTLLEQAAEDSDPLSMMWMARVYSTGRMGFERDEAKARELASSVIADVEASANAGTSEAMLLMGTAFDEGLGKEHDPVQAFEWHLRAAEAGNVLGQHNAGNQYSEGRGADEDPVAAVLWWTKSAERGDATTQLRLGEAYEAGRGVEIDLDEALRWYTLSAGSGNAQAAAAIERLGQS